MAPGERRTRNQPDPGPAAAEGERLQKVLAAAGVGSRRQCEEYIQQGRVTVAGKVVTELGTRVAAAHQEIRFDGEPLRIERKVYWWLNKPTGILCTSRDPQGRTTALDLLPNLGARIYCVGRLDEDSTGLLLLTNDGDLAQRLTHPRYGIAKTYHVLVAGRLTNEELAQLREGVWIAEGKIRPRQVHRLGAQGQATRLEVVLNEGRNREIRRLFAKLGHKVMTLERVAIGPVKLRKLGRGEARPASDDEIAMLTKLASRPAAGRRATKPAAPPRPTRPTKPAPRSRARSQGRPAAGPRKARPKKPFRRAR